MRLPWPFHQSLSSLRSQSQLESVPYHHNQPQMNTLSFSRCPTSSPEECSFPCGDSQGGSKCLDSSQRAATDTWPVCALLFLRSVSHPRLSCHHHETTDHCPAGPYCSFPNGPDRLVLFITEKEQPDRAHAQRLAHTCVSLPPPPLQVN